jgi:hypothetical protein
MAIGLMVFILITGILLALSFFSKEDGTGIYLHRGTFTLVTTAILSILLAILATSKMWYTHLWSKNSSHDRHKQHTKHHPVMQQPPPQHKR